MTYRNTETGERKLTEAQVRERFPNISFCAADFPPAPYVKVQPTAQPAFNALTQDVIEADDVLDAGVWRQAWSVVDVAADVAEQRRKDSVPISVTMRQARLALLGAGLLASVDSAIAAMPSPQKEAAQIEWEYSAEVHRNKALVQSLGPALGLTDAQIDTLFINASKL